MDLALALADVEGLQGAQGGGGASAASCAASASPTPSSAPRAVGLEGAEVRFDRDGTLTLVLRLQQPGPGPRDRVQADRLRPARHRSATRSPTSRATPTRCSSAKAPAARARPTMAGSAFHLASEKVVAKARAIAAHMLQVEPDELRFEEGVFSTSQDQPHAVDQGARAPPRSIPKNLPKGMEPGLSATAVYSAPVANYPNGVPCLRTGDRPRNRPGADRALQRRRRRRHGDQPAAAARPDPGRHRARRRPGADGGHPFRREPASW